MVYPSILSVKMYSMIVSRHPSFHIFSGKYPKAVSEQYRKAHLASFPEDLWIGDEEEEECEDGPKIFMRLKDGTRFQILQCHFFKPRAVDEPEECSGGPNLREKNRRDFDKDLPWMLETFLLFARIFSERGLIVESFLLVEYEFNQTDKSQGGNDGKSWPSLQSFDENW